MVTVCVVEDDTFWNDEICNLLRRTGFVARPAHSAREGLEAVKRGGVSAALVDIIMPDEDGLEFMTAVRKIAPDLKLVAMSGGGRAGPGYYLALARAFGAQAGLAKPFSASELVGALDLVGAGRA